MTPYDELLWWCSEVGSGSVSRLLDSARWCFRSQDDHDAPRGAIVDLQSLGHIEVDWHARRWQTGPTTLCRLEDAGGLWFLTGGRPACLEQAIASLETSGSSEDLDAYQALFLHDPVPQRGPSSLYATFSDTPERREAMQAIGVEVVHDPSGALFDILAGLHAATALGVRRTVRPGELQGRLPAKTWSASFDWEPCNGDDAPGVYRYLRHGKRVFAVRRQDDWVELDRESAVWWGADESRAPLLSRSPGRRQLYVRDLGRLPALVERALVLRTGRLPVVEPDGKTSMQPGPIRVFENVTGSEAGVVSAFLRKRCEIV